MDNEINWEEPKDVGERQRSEEEDNQTENEGRREEKKKVQFAAGSMRP
jgi:hypothetical protein